MQLLRDLETLWQGRDWAWVGTLHSPQMQNDMGSSALPTSTLLHACAAAYSGQEPRRERAPRRCACAAWTPGRRRRCGSLPAWRGSTALCSRPPCRPPGRHPAGHAHSGNVTARRVSADYASSQQGHAGPEPGARHFGFVHTGTLAYWRLHLLIRGRCAHREGVLDGLPGILHL